LSDEQAAGLPLFPSFPGVQKDEPMPTANTLNVISTRVAVPYTIKAFVFAIDFLCVETI